MGNRRTYSRRSLLAAGLGTAAGAAAASTLGSLGPLGTALAQASTLRGPARCSTRPCRSGSTPARSPSTTSCW